MWTTVLLASGLVLLVWGAELLVSGASRLAAIAGVSPLIIGLTVVAFGTSAPELAVSVASALDGRPDLAVGNVIGSNIFNVLFILGLSSMIVPLVVHQNLIRIDVPLMAGISLIVLLAAQDGLISRPEGMVMFTGLLAYTWFCSRVGLNEPADVQQEYETEYGLPQTPSGSAGEGDETSVKPVGRSRTAGRAVLFVLLGLGMLVLGSQFLVSGAVEFARWLGISELAIGLTIVAAGTSLPEVATSIAAAWKGERDIAVGNVIGSNLFNLLGVLGLTAVVSSTGLPVSSQALSLDLPVMLTAALVCIPVFVTGQRIDRWEGGVFLAGYIVYLTVLLTNSGQVESVVALR